MARLIHRPAVSAAATRGAGEGVLAREDQIARPLGHRDRGSVDHRLRDFRQHRCVDDAQARNPLDAERAVDDAADAARADRVMGRVRRAPHEIAAAGRIVSPGPGYTSRARQSANAAAAPIRGRGRHPPRGDRGRWVRKGNSGRSGLGRAVRRGELHAAAAARLKQAGYEDIGRRRKRAYARQHERQRQAHHQEVGRACVHA